MVDTLWLEAINYCMSTNCSQDIKNVDKAKLMAFNYTIYPIKGFIMYRALQLGNPNRLIYGVDSWGNVCNQGNKKIQNVSISGLDHSDKPQALIFRCTPKALTRRIDRITSALNSIFNLIDDNFIELLLFFTFLLLRFFAGIIIWVVYVATTLGTLAATGFACIRYNYYRVKTEYDALLESKRSILDANRIRNWLIGSICVTIATVMQLFKEARQAIADVHTLLIQPIITLIILAGFVLALGWMTLYIETAGHSVIEQTSGYVIFVLDDYFKVLRWYHILGFICFIQFTIAYNKITVADAVVSWYFTRYHLWSAAFGSLLVTFAKFIRLMLQLLKKRLKGRTHPIASFLLMCFSCCLWCFENFIKFIDTNAFIEIALFGQSFCKSAKAALLVMVKNAFRLTIINSVGDFVLFLGKIATVAVVAIIGMGIIAQKKTDVYYPWVPTTLARIFAYFISSCFLTVYEDCAMNDGLQRRYYMCAGLMNVFKNSLKRQNGNGDVPENPVPAIS